MKAVAVWLLRFYPVPWRQRYESEVVALLADHAITMATIVDLLFGAVDAHLDPQVNPMGGVSPVDQRQRARLANRAAFWAFFVFFVSYFFAILDRVDSAWDATRGTPSLAATAYDLAQMSGGVLLLTVVVTSLLVELARARAVPGARRKLRHAAAAVGLPLVSLGMYPIHALVLSGVSWDNVLFFVMLAGLFAIPINLGFVLGSSAAGEFETRIARIASIVVGLGMIVFVAGLAVVQTATSRGSAHGTWSAQLVLAFVLLLVPTVVVVGALVVGRGHLDAPQARA